MTSTIPIKNYIDVTSYDGDTSTASRVYCTMFITTDAPATTANSGTVQTFTSQADLIAEYTGLSTTMQDWISNYFAFKNKDGDYASEIKVYNYDDSSVTPSEALTAVLLLDNNFGSIYYDTTSLTWTQTELDNVTTLIEEDNYKYILFYDDSTYSGSTLTIAPSSSAIIDVTGTSYMPAAELASIEFSEADSLSSFNFLLGSSSDGSINSSYYSNATTNYYNFVGCTQQNADFYYWWQPGKVAGTGYLLSEYVGAMYLQSLATSALLDLQLTVNGIPADNTGISQIAYTLRNSVVEEGLNCGAIQTGRTLTSSEITEVEDATGSSTAYKSIEKNVFYIYTTYSGTTAYFKLFYLGAKNIQLISGSNINL